MPAGGRAAWCPGAEGCSVSSPLFFFLTSFVLQSPARCWRPSQAWAGGVPLDPLNRAQAGRFLAAPRATAERGLCPGSRGGGHLSGTAADNKYLVLGSGRLTRQTWCFSYPGIQLLSLTCRSRDAAARGVRPGGGVCTHRLSLVDRSSVAFSPELGASLPFGARFVCPFCFCCGSSAPPPAAWALMK